MVVLGCPVLGCAVRRSGLVLGMVSRSCRAVRRSGLVLGVVSRSCRAVLGWPCFGWIPQTGAASATGPELKILSGGIEAIVALTGTKFLL